MATGASTAELAVILIDARKGVLTQTRRHTYLVSLLGIRQIVLAVNKMDLVDYSPQTFSAIEISYRQFAAQLGLTRIQAIPVSAVHGDNIVELSANTPWYSGPTMMSFLEHAETEDSTSAQPFRMPVQWVNRPNHEFRGFAGTIVSGEVRPGDKLRVLPSGKESEVARVVTWGGDLDCGVAGQSITLTLKTEIDVSRGDVLTTASSPPQVADQFEATLVWMHDEPMFPGRTYAMKIGAKNVLATVGLVKYRINVNSLEHVAAERLELNDIGVVEIQLDHPIPFQPYKENRELGGFILMDRLTHNTIGAGLLHFSLRRADNIHWQALDVNRKVRARQKRQQPCLLWFTGLSGAGKSTIANLVERRLVSMDRHTYLLDGDNIRHGLNRDLGFTPQDRVENIRRVGEVAKLMVDAGLIVLASFISPFRAERRMVRDLFQPGEFLELFIDAPLEVAEQRDPKGLYKKARRGELKNFTGVDSPYELPEQPEIRIDTTLMTAEEAADEIINRMTKRGILGSPDRVSETVVVQ
jgi:bifunctional enzyme CysN/CysC